MGVARDSQVEDRLTAGDGDVLLDVRDLHVTYAGAVRSLKGVSLAVPEGQVVAVLGSNGAGKSTLLRAVSGTLRAQRGAITGGTIELAGRSLIGADPADIARGGLVQVPEGRRIFGHLTVAENLRAGGMAARDKAARERAQAWVQELFPILAERARQRAGLLSGGEQQMLAIGRALVTNPKLLILDEATEGLAPLVRAEIWRALAQLRADGFAMIVIDKYVQRLIDIGDRHCIVEKGRGMWQGSSRELETDRALWHRYLGV